MLKKYLKEIIKILQEKKEFFLLSGIMALGFGLRLINIGIETYWSDEILSLEIAKHYIGNLSGLWNYLQLVEVHPPLYYYIIQVWGGWFGFDEFSIRFLSLLFSVATVGLTYWAGKILFQNKNIGLLASLFMAVLPIQIEFGQEARPYAIYAFFGMLSFILLAKYFKEKITKKRISYITGFILCSIVGMYLHYSYLLIIVPLSLYWLIKLIIEKSSKEFLWWLISMTIIFIGFYAWLPALIFKSFFMDDVISQGHRMLYSVRSFIFFEESFSKLIWTTKEIPVLIEILSALLVKLIILGLIVDILLKHKDWLKKYKESLIYLGSFFILSIVFFLVLPSSASYTLLLFRHVILSSTILSLLLSAIFLQFNNIRWRTIFISLFLISLLTFQVKILDNDSLYDINHRFKVVVDYINERYQKGDLILVNTARIRPQLNYYLRDDISGFVSIDPTDMFIDDFMASRDLLGFRENESQLRVTYASWPDVDKKITYLVKKHNPKRIWVFGNDSKLTIRKWFILNDWNFGFKPIGSLFPLNLYMQKIEK